jgi:hypothetical protein
VSNASAECELFECDGAFQERLDFVPSHHQLVRRSTFDRGHQLVIAGAILERAL